MAEIKSFTVGSTLPPFPAICSNDAEDLLKKLICEKTNRMGSGNCLYFLEDVRSRKGLEELKMSSFFENFNWLNLREQRSPIIALCYEPPADDADYRDFWDVVDDPEHHVIGKRFKTIKEWIYLNYTFVRVNKYKW